MDYDALAARAGVVWGHGDKFTSGHMARVLLINGDGFYHPCTCDLNANHDALVPTDNPELDTIPFYVQLPELAPMENTDPGDVDPDPSVHPPQDAASSTTINAQPFEEDTNPSIATPDSDPEVSPDSTDTTLDPNDSTDPDQNGNAPSDV